MILSSVLAQGIPTDPLMVLGSADEIPPSKLTEVKKLMIKALERKFPAEKIYTLETDTDAVNLGTYQTFYTIYFYELKGLYA